MISIIIPDDSPVVTERVSVAPSVVPSIATSTVEPSPSFVTAWIGTCTTSVRSLVVMSTTTLVPMKNVDVSSVKATVTE